MQTDDKTLARIQKTLQACETRIQGLYTHLIQEWGDADGKVECLQAGRIYLKFKTREHSHGRYGKLIHDFNLAILSAPAESKEPSIDFAWNLASGEYAYLLYAANEVKRYQEIVSTLPGFLQESQATQIILGDFFQDEHAHKLLRAMLDLKAAAGG